MDLSSLKRVSWYPGHMRQAERQLREILAAVDVVAELVDARAPASTRNDRLGALGERRATVVLLGKSDLADPAATRIWREHLGAGGDAAFSLHHRQRGLAKKLTPWLLEAARRDPRCKWGKRLGWRRPMRAVIVGLPNVGKSSVINALLGKRRAQTGHQPGVTRHQQWVRLNDELELLDTPGMMVPRVRDPETGLRLALLAMVKESLVSPLLLVEYLVHCLGARGKAPWNEVYDLSTEGLDDYDVLLEALARRRGLLQPGGAPDVEQAAWLLLRDFRHGNLGRLTLELP